MTSCPREKEKCLKCGSEFARIVIDQMTGKKIKVGRSIGRRGSESFVCGYCEATIWGLPDARWLGELAKDEAKGRGWQKI